jgi:hypothetical protein
LNGNIDPKDAESLNGRSFGSLEILAAIRGLADVYWTTLEVVAHVAANLRIRPKFCLLRRASFCASPSFLFSFSPQRALWG